MTEVAGLLAGGAGVVKGGAAITGKIAAKAGGKAAKAAGKGAGAANIGKNIPNPEVGNIIKNAEKISTAKPGQATAPRNLKEQIVWDNVVKNPKGAGKDLKGMNNDPRFPESAGFQKMYQRTHGIDGKAIEIHYQYNRYTGKAYDIKITTPERK